MRTSTAALLLVAAASSVKSSPIGEGTPVHKVVSTVGKTPVTRRAENQQAFPACSELTAAGIDPIHLFDFLGQSAACGSKVARRAEATADCDPSQDNGSDPKVSASMSTDANTPDDRQGGFSLNPFRLFGFGNNGKPQGGSGAPSSGSQSIPIETLRRAISEMSQEGPNVVPLEVLRNLMAQAPKDGPTSIPVDALKAAMQQGQTAIPVAQFGRSLPQAVPQGFENSKNVFPVSVVKGLVDGASKNGKPTVPIAECRLGISQSSKPGNAYAPYQDLKGLVDHAEQSGTSSIPVPILRAFMDRAASGSAFPSLYAPDNGKGPVQGYGQGQGSGQDYEHGNSSPSAQPIFGPHPLPFPFSQLNDIFDKAKEQKSSTFPVSAIKGILESPEAQGKNGVFPFNKLEQIAADAVTNGPHTIPIGILAGLLDKSKGANGPSDSYGPNGPYGQPNNQSPHGQPGSGPSKPSSGQQGGGDSPYDKITGPHPLPFPFSQLNDIMDNAKAQKSDTFPVSAIQGILASPEAQGKSGSFPFNKLQEIAEDAVTNGPHTIPISIIAGLLSQSKGSNGYDGSSGQSGGQSPSYGQPDNTRSKPKQGSAPSNDQQGSTPSENQGDKTPYDKITGPHPLPFPFSQLNDIMDNAKTQKSDTFPVSAIKGILASPEAQGKSGSFPFNKLQEVAEDAVTNGPHTIPISVLAGLLSKGSPSPFSPVTQGLDGNAHLSCTDVMALGIDASSMKGCEGVANPFPARRPAPDSHREDGPECECEKLEKKSIVTCSDLPHLGVSSGMMKEYLRATQCSGSDDDHRQVNCGDLKSMGFSIYHPLSNSGKALCDQE